MSCWFPAVLLELRLWLRLRLEELLLLRVSALFPPFPAPPWAVIDGGGGGGTSAPAPTLLPAFPLVVVVFVNR